MKLVRYSSSLAVLALFVFSAASAQEQPKFGRLRDGRAYRINEQGMKMVDYIAELEVTVDDLKRQVAGMEDELESRRKSCPQAKAGSSVSEKELVKSAQPTPNDAQCAAELELVRQKLAFAEQSLRDRGQLQNSGKAEEQLRLEQSQAELAKLEEREKALTAEVERLQGELTRYQKPASEKNSELAGLKSERALRTEAPAASVEGEQSKEPNAQTAASIRQTLRRIQSLISERKDLYDSVRSKVHGVSVSLRPLVTAQGQSLDSLRQRSVNPASGAEQAETDRALREIETLLAEDIKVLKRISRG